MLFTADPIGLIAHQLSRVTVLGEAVLRFITCDPHKVSLIFKLCVTVPNVPIRAALNILFDVNGPVITIRNTNEPSA